LSFDFKIKASTLFHKCLGQILYKVHHHTRNCIMEQLKPADYLV
jgi:hypothetical protein